MILIAYPPADKCAHQTHLFDKALDALAGMSGDLVNKVLEVLSDCSVHISEWNADDYSIGRLSNPRR
jgi:hypothetical protein